MNNPKADELCDRVVGPAPDRAVVIAFCLFVGAIKSLAANPTIRTDDLLEALDRSTADLKPKEGT